MLRYTEKKKHQSKALYVLAELQVNEWLLKKKSPLQRLTRQTLGQKKSQKTKDARCKMQKRNTRNLRGPTL
jgi:hypothetical protein